MEKHRWQEWLLGYRRTGAIQVIYVVYLYGEYSLTKSWWRGNSPWTLAVHRPDSYRCPMSLHPHASDVRHHCTHAPVTWDITAPTCLQGSQAIIHRKKPMCSLSIIPALLINLLGVWVRLGLDGISPLSCLPILPSLAGLQTPTMHALETVAIK